MTRLSFLAFSGLLLTGCASEPPAPPEPPPPTFVNLQINCSDKLNLSDNGAAAPVLVRVYELRGNSGFNSADFFALFHNDQSALGADLSQKSEMLLKPGESKSLVYQLDSDIESLGLFAAFRKLDNAQWRLIADIVPHQSQLLNIKLEDNQLTLDTQH